MNRVQLIVKVISFKKVFKAEYFTTMTTLNERWQSTSRLLASCSTDIETNFINRLKISRMMIDIAWFEPCVLDHRNKLRRGQLIVNKRIQTYYIVSFRQIDSNIIELNMIEDASNDHFPLPIKIESNGWIRDVVWAGISSLLHPFTTEYILGVI
jgi:hypothetical protein